MQNLVQAGYLLGYGIYRAGNLLITPLPLGLVFRIGQLLGLFAWPILRNRRALAIRNLQTALGLTKPDAERIARDHFVNTGANLLCMLKIPSMPEDRLWEHIDFEVECDIPAQPKVGGWVAVLSHMGNWEILGRLGKLLPGSQFGAIYQKLANARVNRHFNQSRAKLGTQLFDRQDDFWQAVAFLESGGVLGILTDQYAGVSGTWMPFFNRLTSTSTLAAAMAHRVGAELVPVHVKTTGIARWKVFVGHPLAKGISVEATTSNINRELERQILESPSDWLWSHDRWKTPRYGFLLSGSQRRISLSLNEAVRLLPYKILIRSADDPAEAEASLAAVQAIKAGRPDAHVTMLSPLSLTDIWKNCPAVDDVISYQPGAGATEIAKRIKQAGDFSVGILFPGHLRTALEMTLAGVPYRFGPPHRQFLNHWKNAVGADDPPAGGPERYRRIALAAGARIE
jgi:lauroyl/myristoyl acyltransferase